jgi:hypothetical protein
MTALFDWENSLPPEWQVYAIIDPLADNKPLEHWYRYAAKTDAWPLYAGTEFKDEVLYGPWLLPLAQLPGWQEWWRAQEQAGYATGILIASEHPSDKLVQHWRSLLLAGLDGEEVLFRYYDPRVIAPMLYTFTQDETRRFLGPTNELLLWHHDDWLMAAPYPEPDLTEHAEAWWRMKNEHFVGQPGEKSMIINNIDDWLWQNKPTLMKQWLKRNNDVRTALADHYDQMTASGIPTLWQPVWLLLNLFGHGHWWPAIQPVVQHNEADEQTDLMANTLVVIEKHTQH